MTPQTKAVDKVISKDATAIIIFQPKLSQSVLDYASSSEAAISMQHHSHMRLF